MPVHIQREKVKKKKGNTEWSDAVCKDLNISQLMFENYITVLSDHAVHRAVCGDYSNKDAHKRRSG